MSSAGWFWVERTLDRYVAVFWELLLLSCRCVRMTMVFSLTASGEDRRHAMVRGYRCVWPKTSPSLVIVIATAAAVIRVRLER